MMVNGVALSSMIAGGWGGGAVPNATGTAEFAIDVSAVDAQAATGGVRINFIPRDGGNRFSGTIAASYATESFASDNFTGSDVQQRGLSVPGHDQGERRLQSRIRRTHQARQAVVLPLRPQALRRQLRPQHVLQRERERHQSLRLRAVAEPGHPPPGADDLPGPLHLAGRARSTRSASPPTRRASAPARPASDRSQAAPTCRPRPATIGASRCSASSPSTGTRRSATACSSRRAASTASSAGAAWIRRSASWATSTT